MENNLSMKDTVPTIPPSIIYPKPTTPYHSFINRVCQSKSKMMKCTSKEEAIALGNKLWETYKKDNDYISEYNNSNCTYPVLKKKDGQQNLKAFFKKPQCQLSKENENIRVISDDLPLNITADNEKKVFKRKTSEITNHPSNDTIELKKSKKSQHLYNLDLIVEYIFAQDKTVAQEIKSEIKQDLSNEILSHENMYMSLTSYINQKQEYDKLSTFSIKENTTLKQINKLEEELQQYGKSLKSIRDIRMKMREYINDISLSRLRNSDQLREFELICTELKGNNLIHMVTISSLVSLISPVLSKRISNAKYYKKASLAPAIYTSPLKFLCFNISEDWSFAQKLLNIIILEDGRVYPLEISDCINIISLFKDTSSVVIKLSTIFDFVFPNDDSKYGAKKSKIESLNMILLKIFPLMSVKVRGETYLLDVAKMTEDNELMLDCIYELLEEERDIPIKNSNSLVEAKENKISESFETIEEIGIDKAVIEVEDINTKTTKSTAYSDNI